MTAIARRVHRLLDMLVEEVSLVDRAANNRRFLMVKRDDPMKKTKGALSARQKAREGTTRTQAAPDSAPPTPATPPPTPPDAAPGSAAGTRPPDGVTKEAAGPLGVALSALESLTEVVELLSTVAEGEGAADLPALAGELREAADALAGAAGYEPASDEGEAGDEGAEADGGDVSAVIAAVRTTLADVQSLLADAGGGAVAEPADKAVAADGLGAVATALKALHTAVTAQGARLTALEKRAGVPQSRAPEAPPARPAAPAEVSWPLDLNRPLDRSSVDRAVSFHDV